MTNSTITISGGEVDVFSESVSNTDIQIVAGGNTILIIYAEEDATAIVINDPHP